MTKLSIIVSFYRRVEHLRLCLAALEWSRSDFHEVVIADDGSDEEAVAKAKALAAACSFPARHVWQPKDGFRLSANRNNGVRAATGDRLLFIDCDFVLLPGAVRAHAEAAKPGRFVAALCKYLPEGPSTQWLQAGPTADAAVRAYDDLPQRPIQRAHEKFLWYSALIRLRLAPHRKLRCSSHFSIGRSDFEAINGYDEQFRGWGGEDEDMAHRMMLARMRPCSVIPRARTLHVWHQPELGGRHWREGSNIEYLNRTVVPARCEVGYARPHAPS